ncbi:MAG TPA: BrnT family toxin [Aurantimonas coralicida]|uniref:BrnT family toxin n=2 Tax=root TaxID=1 RepID=A0A9C9NDM4_9HYPH|nr:BrnT family toxin [Aurantimonas coralicida]HET99349.1 BrnT family toxin [Aurantimonas coralicida]
MELEWDEEKRRRTLLERGLDFADVVEFEFETATTVEDNRRPYGEARMISTGYFRGRVCVVCYTYRRDCVRIISFRKANSREIEDYEQTAGR